MYNIVDFMLSFLLWKKIGRSEWVGPLRNAKEFFNLSLWHTDSVSPCSTSWTMYVSCGLLGCPAGSRVLCLLRMYVAVCRFCQQEPKNRRKFNRGNSQGGVEIHTSVKWKWQSVSASIREHYQKNKNKSATLDCKEQHGVNSTKRENNTNCLPVIN